jgi:hypothetical protein
MSAAEARSLMTDAVQIESPASVRISRRTSLLANLIAAPFTYIVLIPLALLDVTASLYQAVCFRVWQIVPVPRTSFMRLDRHKLAYLNGVQKLNCHYCAYATGVLGYVTEIVSKTEQYWCPIQHEIDPTAPHTRYRTFIAYGDRHAWRERWAALRQKLRDERGLSSSNRN